MMKNCENEEKWGKMRKNRKSEAAKARSGSRGPPAETGNRKPEAVKARSGQQRTPSRNLKPEAAKARSGSRGPPAETGNRKPETGSGNGEKCGKMMKIEEKW